MSYLHLLFVSFVYHVVYLFLFLFNLHREGEAAFVDFFLETLTQQELDKTELDFIEENLSDVVYAYTAVFFLLPTVRERTYKEIFPLAQRKIRWLQMTRR